MTDDMRNYKVSFTATTADDPSALLDAAIEVAGRLEGYLSDCLVDENTVCVADTNYPRPDARDLAVGETGLRELAIKVVLKDNFLWGVFVTALEGGIGYWSACSEYKPWKVDGEVEDYENFHAVVRVGDGGDDTVTHTINAAVIHKGIMRILSKEVTLNAQLYGWLFTGVTSDPGMIDSDVADCVVQAGLFKEIVYG